MTSLTSFSSKAGALALAAVLSLPGCAGGPGAAKAAVPVRAGMYVAVLPVENLTGGVAPLKDIRQSLEKALTGRGLGIVGDDVLEQYMARHRMRYTGGLDHENSIAMKAELGVDAVFITSLGLYSAYAPPKIALTARLVSTGPGPEIIWIDGLGMAGDDSPGIFELGLIDDPKALTDKALGRLAGSLAAYLDGGARADGCKSWEKFRPRISYRSPELDPGGRYSVAVLPFLNNSSRKDAADLMALQFVRQLGTVENFRVVEPGLVREELLKYRIVLEGGVSLDNAGIVLDTLDADLVLAGNVLDYEDYQGLAGTPKVGFSAIMIQRKDRAVVWESRSYNEGDQFVYFFDRGKVNTASDTACRMVKDIVLRMVEK